MRPLRKVWLCDRSFFADHHPEWTRQKARGELPDLSPGAAIFGNGVAWIRENR